MMKKATFLLQLLLRIHICFAQVNHHSCIINADSSSRNESLRTRFSFNQLYIPSFLIFSGIALNGSGPEAIKNEIVEERNEHWPKFNTQVDNYLQFTPILIAYGLDAFGIKSQTDIVNRTAILIKGELCMMASVSLLKHYTHIQRPDYSNYNSFPSGHTAQAFAAATFLNEEYKRTFKWMPYVSYGIATSVGVLRMANNKHYISDVLVGAGIGILSMKLSYWTHQYKWNKKGKAIKPPL